MSSSRPIFDPDRIQVQPEAVVVPRVVTVSQLNAIIKRILGDHLPGTIDLIGEVSNLTRAGSGHLYLTLKDEHSEMRCAMWKSAAVLLKFAPADGMQVIATGHVDVYAPRGQYQFYIHKLEPRGVGALELAFRQLRDRLQREGLFEPARRKPIPRFPRRIAVVTSPTGAAVQDILRTLRRRFPCVHILLAPVRVQGEGAASEIAEAIGRLNHSRQQVGGIDVIIVARGGGSLEDLWAFNEEAVARAIHASHIPVISGVGHETDVTIADLAADLRAATPTAAAEHAVPVLDEVLANLGQLGGRIHRSARHLADLARARVEAAARSEWMRDPLAVVHRFEQRVDETSASLRHAVARRTTRSARRLHELEIALAACSPQATLHRRTRLLEDLTGRLNWAGSRMLSAKSRLLSSREVRLAGVQPAAILRRHRDRLEQLGQRFEGSLRHHLVSLAAVVQVARRSLLAASPRRQIPVAAETLRTRENLLLRAASARLQSAQQRIEALATCLEATSFRRTLARGFSITRTADGSQIITAPQQVAPDQTVVTETAAGQFASRVIAQDHTPA
jgi:exodeoxyribonuclease VII large subunit